ncbi:MULTISPECIES: hypothetical protein [unclassified Sinorhizobium]
MRFAEILVEGIVTFLPAALGDMVLQLHELEKHELIKHGMSFF